jgi:putative ABC transport system permease protein
MDVAFDAEILVTGALAANGFLLAVAAATLATLYPAWKASRLPIVDALRRSR